ncbi:Phosphatidate cytidylyltransferase, photoreceptor-specific isoform 1 [Schistosoma japonicum]|uniref:Phosphatidate cytidylyltransferase n=1 Tax=Schistosoma japonicum TaxID=6182 RepID=A0A4Z2D4Z6_SCHJA|nr:Phosphatidate cytidylyltransferase, photoreceptor-specific [Schistosoma japonicum]KAH8857709.1 Phosphatidate cytidylyltransferase, photoreceptor-specific [Schistosoma japonicum]TNN11542.1 Phosphatidate cytidylyltransferase, photoreceptor-specific isoform 1 [Schistosoma japonicum]TNN11544.1 Phosphatidate cytidylyltransferase, photoreceptor-specific isoform 1 [Schistosoma japonicum]
MSEEDQSVRQRTAGVMEEPTTASTDASNINPSANTEQELSNCKRPTTDEDDDEPIDPIRPDFEAAEKLHQGTGHVPSIIGFLNKFLPPRWVNWTVRLFTAVLLITGFTLLIYLGPLALVLMVLSIQLACFYEIINIGYLVYRSHDLPWFRALSWYFLFTSNYYLFGESLITRFRLLLAKEDFLQPWITHHQFISFSLYCAGIVAFVLSLVKRHYIKQFTLFGWTHVTLLIFVTSSYFCIENIFNGLIWFLLPVCLVICNDIMAYVFGFFYGKTPLIKLSPKKTWEGFIGGGLFTILFGFLFSYILLKYDYFVCPIEWDDAKGSLTMNCTRNHVFIAHTYSLPRYLFFLPIRQITWYPFMQHCFIISIYTSVVGPFGGFFASGFKRAFKIKDFGDLFPGHGGVVDRFDCQLLIGTFVSFYYNSFVRTHSPVSLLSKIYVLPPNAQILFYRLLTDGLCKRGLLPYELMNAVNEYLPSSGSSTTRPVDSSSSIISSVINHVEV